MAAKSKKAQVKTVQTPPTVKCASWSLPLKTQKKAVKEGRMISMREQTIRKTIGGSVAAVSFLLFYLHLIGYGMFTLATAAGAVVYSMGARSQWGGVMKGKWNLDGKGLVPIPKKFKSFVRMKQKQFISDAVLISACAHAFTCYVAWQRGELGADLLLDFAKWNGIALAGTVVLILRT